MGENGSGGVAAAELAMQVLEQSGPFLSPETWCDLRAVGWARVGRARLEAGDVIGAVHAFEFCDEEWLSPRNPRDRLAEAEIGVLKAPLRIQQRRFDEACQLVDRAIELFREKGASERLARALVDRARMARHRDDEETDLALLEEARKLVDETSDPALACRTLLRLAQAKVRAGSSRQAEAALAEARAAAGGVDDPPLRALIDRTEGLVHRELGRAAEAEACLVRACEAFIALGDLPRAVLTTLDLAELLHLRGNAARVRDLVVTAVGMVERLKMHRRSLKALRLLKTALDAEELTLTLLRRVRSCVEAIHRDAGTT